MNRSNPSPAVLEGLDAIAAYLGKSRATIWRWIHHDGFPAMKLPSGRWFITKHAITTWIFASHTAEIVARKEERLRRLEDKYIMENMQ